MWTYGDLVYGLRHAGVAPLVGPRSSPGETADAVRYRQDLVAVIDSLTSCAFGSYAFTVQDYADALSLVTDEPVTATALLATGARIFDAERALQPSPWVHGGGRHAPTTVHEGAGPRRHPCRARVLPRALAGRVLCGARLGRRPSTLRARGPTLDHGSDAPQNGAAVRSG